MTELNFYEDLLGLSELSITSIEKDDTKFIFYCQHTKKEACCPNCLEPTAMINQTQMRKFRDLKIVRREVWLHIEVPQFYCVTCQRYFLSHPDWVVAGKSYTERQAKWIFEMCKKQSFTAVAVLGNMCVKTVERLFYTYAKKVINLPERYANVRKLGIDEVSHRKGKKDYVCVLTDLDTGRQLDVLRSRKKEVLLSHFQSLGEDFCQQIEVVACDIWRPYIDAAKTCFPNTQIVIDRFHVVKALNEVLDAKRKELRKTHKDEDCFKSIKWKLFKRPCNCTTNDKNLLQKAFDNSWELEELYALRNSFNDMFDTAPNQRALITTLHAWMKHAEKLNYAPLNKFLKTLTNWKKEITAFANEHITNAVTEGLNNLLRYVKRISFGLPNFEHMRLRILVASE